MYISLAMKRLARYLVVLSYAAISTACASAQLVPGQLPDKPTPPGQIEPKAPKKVVTDPPSSFTPQVSKTASDLAEKSNFSIRTQSVLVPTSVFDPDGHGYVNGLQASDFEVLDNDKPQRVQAEVTEQPLSVVLVLQANADVEPLLPKIRSSGILLHGLVTGVEGDLAVLTFDHQMHHALDFTSDPDKIDDAMHKIHTGSNTAAVIDAVVEADDMIRRHDPTNKRRRVILLMSRNVDKGSQMHLDAAIQKMQFDSITVYSVNISRILTALMKTEDYPRPAMGGIPPEGMPPVGGGNVRSGTSDIQQNYGENALNAVPPIYHSIRDLFKKTPAEALSSITGGTVYGFGTQKGLEEAISDIGKDLNSQYILSYSPTSAVMEEPGYHSIRVLVNQARLDEFAPVSGYWWGGGQMQ